MPRLSLLSRVSKCENREAPASWRRKCREALGARHHVRRGSARDRLSQRWVNPITQTLTPALSLRYVVVVEVLLRLCCGQFWQKSLIGREGGGRQ